MFTRHTQAPRSVVLVGLLALTGCTGVPLGAASTPPAATAEPTDAVQLAPASVTSADGWIAYQAESFDRKVDGIFLVRPDGSEDHEILLDLPGLRRHPDFSPDGTMMAFDQGDTGTDQVYVAAADGTAPRLVAECDPANCLQMWEPSWSPDGTRLAISTAVPGDPWMFGIGILDVATGALTQVVIHPIDDGQDHFARWSPEGQRLVFWRGDAGDGGDTAIFIVNVDGTGLTQLTETEMVAGDPDFSPDGTRILFTTHPLLQYPNSGQSELYTMALDGSDVTQITDYGDDGPRATQARWTADGTAIIYTRTTQSGMPRTIYAMNADGSDDGPVATEKPVYTHPVLQPGR